MDPRKSPILIDLAKCYPCSGLICVGVCPVGVLESGAKNKPQVVDVASCTQCGVCVNLCPAKAISINSSDAKKGK